MNLGSFLGRVGSGIGGGIRKGIGRLGEMQGGDGEAMAPMLKLPQTGPGGTGGFAGNEGLPKLGMPMGGDSGLMNRPQPAPQIMPTQLPQIQRPPAPAIEPIRDSVNISATNSGPVGGSDTLGSMMGRMANAPAEVENQQTQMIGQRPVPVVRPPDLLGLPGDTLDDTPMNHARYRYQTQYMDDKMRLRPVEGANGARGYQAEYGGHIPRRWQDITMNALHGAALGYQNGGGWQGALGGAGAGAAGSAIDPTRGRDFRFNQERVPRLEANRADLERGQDRQFEMQKRGADLEGSRARTQATIAGTKDAELERSKLSSLIKLNEAKRLALESGKVQVVEIEDPQTGQVRLLRVNNDGSVDLGASGRAAMNADRIESREKIAGNQIKSREGIADKQIGAKKVIVGMQQGGANYRAGMSQSGQNNRQKERLGAQYGDTYVPPQGAAPPVGSVPNLFPGINKPSTNSAREQFIQKAIEAGHSRAAAEAEATKRKY